MNSPAIATTAPHRTATVTDAPTSPPVVDFLKSIHCNSTVATITAGAHLQQADRTDADAPTPSGTCARDATPSAARSRGHHLWRRRMEDGMREPPPPKQASEAHACIRKHTTSATAPSSTQTPIRDGIAHEPARTQATPLRPREPHLQEIAPPRPELHGDRPQQGNERRGCES